jgi:hypothetical protein
MRNNTSRLPSQRLRGAGPSPVQFLAAQLSGKPAWAEGGDFGVVGAGHSVGHGLSEEAVACPNDPHSLWEATTRIVFSPKGIPMGWRMTDR